MTARRPGVAPGSVFAVACLGIAIFSCMDAAMKGLTIASGVYNAMLWRSIGGMVLSGALYLPRRAAWPGRPALALHLRRGVIVTAMALLFFWGLARVPMAQAIALCFIAPLLAVALGALLLGERVARGTWGASALAFAGVLVIMAGQARAEMGVEALHGALAILAAAFCYAYNLILMRRQGAHSDAIEVAFFQNLATGGLLLIAAPWLGMWPGMSQLPVIALAALFATISIILLAWAYARGEASRLAPSEYSGFLWAGLLGFAVFDERVQAWTVAGAAFIILGCVIAARTRGEPPVEAAL